jgi:hypothetical protein
VLGGWREGRLEGSVGRVMSGEIPMDGPSPSKVGSNPSQALQHSLLDGRQEAKLGGLQAGGQEAILGHPVAWGTAAQREVAAEHGGTTGLGFGRSLWHAGRLAAAELRNSWLKTCRGQRPC